MESWPDEVDQLDWPCRTISNQTRSHGMILEFSSRRGSSRSYHVTLCDRWSCTENLPYAFFWYPGFQAVNVLVSQFPSNGCLIFQYPTSQTMYIQVCHFPNNANWYFGSLVHNQQILNTLKFLTNGCSVRRVSKRGMSLCSHLRVTDGFVYNSMNSLCQSWFPNSLVNDFLHCHIQVNVQNQMNLDLDEPHFSSVAMPGCAGVLPNLKACLY